VSPRDCLVCSERVLRPMAIVVVQLAASKKISGQYHDRKVFHFRSLNFTRAGNSLLLISDWVGESRALFAGVACGRHLILARFLSLQLGVTKTGSNGADLKGPGRCSTGFFRKTALLHQRSRGEGRATWLSMGWEKGRKAYARDSCTFGAIDRLVPETKKDRVTECIWEADQDLGRAPPLR